ALTADGRLFTWGYGMFGQLGLRDNANQNVPRSENGREGKPLIFAQIAMGGNHSAALTADGRLFTWGYGRFGQLGLRDNTNRNTPTVVNGPDGKPMIFAQIALGDNHSAALTADGRLFTWGYGFFGQLGLRDNANQNVP